MFRWAGLGGGAASREEAAQRSAGSGSPAGGRGAAAAMKKQFNRMKQLANQTVGRWATGSRRACGE